MFHSKILCTVYYIIRQFDDEKKKRTDDLLCQYSIAVITVSFLLHRINVKGRIKQLMIVFAENTVCGILRLAQSDAAE